MDIYRTFHPKTTEYTFFSSALGTFSKMYHNVGHKSSLGEFKKIEIVSSIFSDHSSMRLDINYRKKSVKNTNTWRLNNTLLNNQEITEEIKEDIKKYLETNDNENTTAQNLWNAAKAVLRGTFLAIQSYLKKQETSQISNLTLHLKELEKEEEKNPKVSRRKEIIKIRSEINEKEMKERRTKINKTKSWFFEKINKFDKPLARLIRKKREKQQITHKGIPIRLTAELSAETLQARREWQDIFKVMKGKNLQPRLPTQQGSHSDSMEKLEILQTGKS